MSERWVLPCRSESFERRRSVRMNNHEAQPRGFRRNYSYPLLARVGVGAGLALSSVGNLFAYLFCKHGASHLHSKSGKRVPLKFLEYITDISEAEVHSTSTRISHPAPSGESDFTEIAGSQKPPDQTFLSKTSRASHRLLRSYNLKITEIAGRERSTIVDSRWLLTNLRGTANIIWSRLIAHVLQLPRVCHNWC